MITKIRKSVRRWAYDNDTFIRRGRAARMLDMVRLLRVPSGARIVDLGGTPYVWGLIEHDFEITLVNLPKLDTRLKVDESKFKRIGADATNLKDVIADQSFDVCFSNSVIEHVGESDMQRKFAEEARRIAKAYWVQTPGDHFLIEPHTGWPLYWHLKRLMHRPLARGDIRVLSLPWMRELFPDGQVYVERLMGMQKSYAMYRPYPDDDRQPATVSTVAATEAFQSS